MSGFNLVKFDGKPLEKLIEVISSGIGTLYRPIAIKKEARAEAYKIEVIELAKAKALAENKLLEVETLDRIEERVIHRELKRQDNIDNVVQVAAEQISIEEEISEDPIPEDWTSRFFNIVQDISDEDMQKLWGRVLAGEVSHPNSYSYRTLEVLKNLSKKDAEVFTRIANLSIHYQNSPFIFREIDQNNRDNYGFTFSDQLLLVELGLLQSEANVVRILYQHEVDLTLYYIYGEYLIKSIKKANSPEQNFEIFLFTTIGQELLNLLSISPIKTYIRVFMSKLEQLGLEVSYTDILKRNNDGTIAHGQWKSRETLI
ncbi:DUF2806 domain-containing protein [Sphingobacterium sp.]|uniref:DUF2806 domain-containing protein n=1 Tax=Sphingobacterium sp. TaxID=341027 RepID=UPI0031DEED94